MHHTKAGEVAGPLDGSQVRTLPFPARHVALYWAGNPEAGVSVAFSGDGVTFGAATPVEHDEVGMQRNNGQTYGTIVPAANATFVRITTDRPLGRLTVLALAEEGTSVQRTPVPGNPAGAAATVLPRSGWGADESLRFRGPKVVWPPVFQTVQKLVVHHTAGANGETGDVAKATIRSIYYYHSVTQGWGDIGYNFLVDAAGVVYKGRSTSSTKTDVDVTGENAAAQGVTGGHAFGYNSGSVGIALLGNFVDALPAQAAQDALRGILVAKAGAHGLHTAMQGLYTNPVNGAQAVLENLPGHTEVPDNLTECPGGTFLDTVFRAMRDQMVEPAGPADTMAPAEAGNLKGALNKRLVQLTWSASSGDTGSGGVSGVAGYDVWRSAAGGQPVRLTSTTGLTFTDNATTRGTTYDYYVRRTTARPTAVRG